MQSQNNKLPLKSGYRETQSTNCGPEALGFSKTLLIAYRIYNRLFGLDRLKTEDYAVLILRVHKRKLRVYHYLQE